MKRNSIFGLLIMVMVQFNAQAQKLYVGIGGGLLKNSMIIEDWNTSNPYGEERILEKLNSFTGGLFLGCHLNNHWSLEAQFRKVNIRSKERIDLLYEYLYGNIAGTRLAQVDWYHNYHYLRIPVMVQYHVFPKGSRLNINFLAGPNLGFLIQQTAAYKGINELGIEKEKTLSFEEIPLKKFDFGFQLGIRTQAVIYKKLSAFIEGNMYQGFNSIIKYPEPAFNRTRQYFESTNMVNRHFGVDAGVLVDISLSRKSTSQPKDF